MLGIETTWKKGQGSEFNCRHLKIEVFVGHLKDK